MNEKLSLIPTVFALMLLGISQFFVEDTAVIFVNWALITIFMHILFLFYKARKDEDFILYLMINILIFITPVFMTMSYVVLRIWL